MIANSPYIMTLFIAESVIIFFAFVGAIFAFKIAKKFNPNSLNPMQYKLAQTSYLISTIVMFILALKIPLFLFFIWSMDHISSLVPGAMCAVGIVDASEFGIYMLFFKIINIFLLSGWLYLNNEDSKTPSYEFTKLKFSLYMPLFVLVLLEVFLEFSHFLSISTKEPVVCCSELFKAVGIENLPFYQKNGFVIFIFYLTFLLTFVSNYLRLKTIFGLFSLIFMLVSIYAVIRYFSPYIYALPTHKCPFCMLQKDYYYVGYLIYILIFLSAISGIIAMIAKVVNLKVSDFWYRLAFYASSSLVILLSMYPLIYRLKNGVWL